jgi:uncharacterized membrane protein YczE
MIKRIFVLVVMVCIVGTSAALTLKGAIGVGAWDALAATTSNVVTIPVGTVGMCFNFLCIAVELIVLKKNFRKLQFLQIPLSFLLGVIVNFVLYDILDSFTIDSYAMRMALLVGGLALGSFGVGCVMVINMVTFPLEGACMAISEKTGKKFHNLRQLVDVLSVIAVLLLVLVWPQPLEVREGTIIGVLIFGPLMGIFMKLVNPIFKKYQLCYRETK